MGGDLDGKSLWTSAKNGLAEGVRLADLNVRGAGYDRSVGGAMGKRQDKSPNDQRSEALNPNSAANKAARDNRANQLNPDHPAYHSSRRKPDGEP